MTNSKKFRELCPSWSPDEKKILFKGSLRRNHSEIYVMNSDGSGRKKLTNNNRNDKGASWSPEGKKILFDKSLRKRKRRASRGLRTGKRNGYEPLIEENQPLLLRHNQRRNSHLAR